VDYAVRAAQDQACAEINRYADDLAANPPVAHVPRRIDIDVGTDSGIDIAAPPVEAADMPLIAAAEDLSRQVAGLPDWRIEAPAAASSLQAVRT
jgi:multidrug resistance protein MdtO